MKRFASIALGLLLSGCGADSPPPIQSVLLVTIDTLRADRLGAYGYRAARTPHLDRLASEGLLFEDVVTSVPVTLPSHASLLTGLLPPTHGVRDNTYFRLDAEARTLAEILKERGYETAAFVGAFVLDSSFGLDQGFDTYDDAIAEEARYAGTVAERRGEEVTAAFRSWIEGRTADRPFFAWIHYFDPHLPYSHGGYDGEIAYVDEQLGNVLPGLEENTLVVVTSDHGESLGEHGEKSHGFFVYDATLRVPLILKGPSLPPGKRIASAVRTIDVVPTVLEAVGVPPPDDLDGRSLFPLLSGENPEPRAAYGECYVSSLNFHWAPLLALRDDGYKYIEAPRPELYDLKADPGETRNRYHTDRERALSMRTRLLEMVEALPPSLSSRHQPDPETVERLRALGYAASGGADSDTERTELPDPKDRLPLWTQIEEAILHQGAGEHGRAIEAAQGVLEEDPTNLLALELVASARAAKGERAEAIAIYRRLLSIDASRPLTHVLLGNLLWQSGDLEGAESSFRAALERDPDFARAHRRLGELYFRRGDREKALASFGRAAELAPDDAESRLGIARSLKASGDVASAMKELEALYRRSPQDPEVLSEYAATLAQQGDSEQALALLAKGPDHHDLHYTASVILRSLDRIPEALAELDRALALSPDSAVSLHDRGVILSRMGRLEEAVASLEKALQIQESPSTRNALGTALCRMDRCAEGVRHFERAVALAPNFVEALENLAQGYAVVGRARDAEQVQKRAEALRNRP